MRLFMKIFEISSKIVLLRNIKNFYMSNLKLYLHIPHIRLRNDKNVDFWFWRDFLKILKLNHGSSNEFQIQIFQRFQTKYELKTIFSSPKMPSRPKFNLRIWVIGYLSPCVTRGADLSMPSVPPRAVNFASPCQNLGEKPAHTLSNPNSKVPFGVRRSRVSVLNPPHPAAC